MASTAPVTLRGQDPKPVQFCASLAIHSFIVYSCAIQLSPWLVYHWFGWVVPIAHLPVSVPAGDWFLRHLELITIAPALILGYFNITRLLPQVVRAFLGESNLASAAIWGWTAPAFVLVCKMFLYHGPHSVLYGSSMGAFEYFFDIQKVMPTRMNSYSGDVGRVLTQMLVTAPFYSGIAYSLGALAAKRSVITKLFTFEHSEELTNSTDAQP